jgi:hypothetical protein
MSSLTDIEKRYLEKLFGMRGGYVLDFTDATFGGLFNHYGINIHSNKCEIYGTSKAIAHQETQAWTALIRSFSQLILPLTPRGRSRWR